MSSLDEPIAAADRAQMAIVLPTRWERFETRLALLSDRLNPILVKEARQALRSRQFTTTFLMMLAGGWAWSILGLALLGPAAYYNAEGPAMFFVYYVILAAPLLIVIPYTAFQSLSTERQDRTYELVSITALNARRILTGKLCGIGLQMMVYMSALFPCLAFTYLLRGLTIFSVFLVVAYTCFLSLGLAMLGLLLATLAPPRQRQIGHGVAFAVVLVYTFGLTLSMMSGIVAGEGVRVDDPDFWQSNLLMATIYFDAFAVVFLAARAQLTTASQNRSTAQRIALAAAQMSMIAWTAWAVLQWEDKVVFGLIFGSTVCWFFAGTILVGESRVLSPRVKRGLPQSALARVFLTLFSPGPGTGYLFVVANMIAMSSASILIAASRLKGFGDLFQRTRPGTTDPMYEVFVACIVATSYVAIYLGLGKLILGVIARLGEIRLTVRVLVHALLLLAGGGIPWVVQITYPPTRELGYTLLQTTNPVWTLWESCVDGPLQLGDSVVLTFVLPAAALVVWLMNLPSLAAELKQSRVAKPARVAEEDALSAAPVVTGPVRTNPWDD
jgi:hypothetical protein